MKKPTEIYNILDVVAVPFPFTDTAETKNGPAVILSSASEFNQGAGASIMAMITSSSHSPWPHDIEIIDLLSAGLPVQSIIRMKIFTLDHRLILKRIGVLNTKDQKKLTLSLNAILQI